MMFFLFIFFFSCESIKATRQTNNTIEPSLPLEDEDYLTIDTLLNHPESKLAEDDPADEEEKSPGVLKGSFIRTSHSLKETFVLKKIKEIDLKNTVFDIPVVDRPEVIKWIEYFTGPGKKYFLNYSKRSGRYGTLMSKMLQEKNLPQDLIYLAMAESGFHTKAQSWAKAVGPWQFMPFTGKQFGLNLTWYIDERRDPFKSTLAATEYLTYLFNRFGSWELAIAAYNCGDGKIFRTLKKHKATDFWSIKKYLKQETQNYVPKIMALAILGKNLEVFDLHKDYNPHQDLSFQIVEVSELTDINLVAEKLGTSFDVVHYLNPELLRWLTPPNKNYPLKIPVATKHSWDDDFKNLVTASQFKIHKMNSKETIKSVAKKYRLSENVLKELNPKKNLTLRLPFRSDHSLKEVFYKDLYEPIIPRKRLTKNHQLLATAKKRGTTISNPKEFYRAKKGDTLWTVAKKNNIPFYTLLKNNSFAIQRLKPGDKLVIR